MIHLVVSVQAKKAKASEMANYLREISALSAKEKGCHKYVFYVHPDDPEQFLLHEIWADQASLDKHSQSEHFLRIVPLMQSVGTLHIQSFKV